MNKQKQSLMTKRAHELRQKPTKAELKMISLLDELKVQGFISRYIFQSPRWHDNCFRIFDFWIPAPHRIRIEVDGKYHKKEIDEQRDEKLKQARPTYTTIRFTNDQVFNEINIIKKLLIKAFNASLPKRQRV